MTVTATITHMHIRMSIIILVAIIIIIIIIVNHIINARARAARARAACTPNPPTKNSGFRGFDSSRLLILRGGILMSVNFDRGSPGKFDSRTLNRKPLNRWTGRTSPPSTRAADQMGSFNSYRC